MLAEKLRERRRQFGTANPKPSYTGTQKDLMTLSTWKRTQEMMLMAEKGTGKRETIPAACTVKDSFALSADVKLPESQQKTIIILTLTLPG